MKINLNRIFSALLVAVLFVACGTVCAAHEGHHSEVNQTKPETTTSTGRVMAVVRTNGAVDEFADMPEVRFMGAQMEVGGRRYSLDQVQRIEYGKSVKGVKNTADYSKEKDRSVYIYRHDGEFNAFSQSKIQRMSHRSDILEVATVDSLYKIPLSAVDSIGVHAFSTVYAPKVIILKPYEPYIEDVSVENGTIRFAKNLPADMKPEKDDILYCDEMDNALPEGFAGRVITTDGYSCSTEPVGIDDIYERIVLHTEFTPTKGQNYLAYADTDPDWRVKGPFAPQNDSKDQKIGISLHGINLSLSYGGVSVAVDTDIDPEFDVSIVKLKETDNAKIVVDMKVATTVSSSLSVGGGGGTKRHEGPSITPMAKVVIPACPIVSVGLDMIPFIEAEIEGSITVGATATAVANFHLTYCDGDVSFKPSFKGSTKVNVPDVKAEGSVYAGMTILPSVQMTGGLFKLGPVFDIGPKAEVTLDINTAGVVNCAYDVIKDSKISVSLAGQISANLRVLQKAVGATKMPKLPFSILGLDRYFVPLYTQPTVAPARKENVGVATNVTRELIFPVSTGIDILYSDEPMKYYDAGSYWSDPVNMRSHFSGFEEGQTYTAVPTVDIFGIHILAAPRTNFTIEKEEQKPKPEEDPGTLERPQQPTTSQEFKTPTGYRFEWKDSNGDHGYFERRNNMYLNYTYSKRDGDGITHRYNDKEETYAWKSDSYSQWWVDDNEFDGSDEYIMHKSRELYKEYFEGRMEMIEEAGGLWNVFADELGGVAYFEETFRRHYRQTFGTIGGENMLKKDYVGTGTICGIKCNIYDNHKRWPQQAKVWADPKTGLCLRYELDDGYWFEVTNYQINDYEF